MIISLNTASVTYWKQERLIIRATGQSSKVRIWSNLEGSYSSPIATYTPTSAGLLVIDVTDYVRAYASSITTIYARSESSSTQINISITIAGLINPANEQIPPQSLKSYNALVIPPQMYYASQGDDVEAEFYALANSGTWSVSGSASISQDHRNYGQIGGDYAIIRNGSTVKGYKARPTRCDVTYALVQWVSFSGATRKHWFEVVKQKNTTDSAYSLMAIDNEYAEIKGRLESLTLRLDKLNLYDLWYYADLLQSSKVQVSYDNTTWRSVQVTDKSITMPDGEAGTDGVLEVALNYRKYDAVAM